MNPIYITTSAFGTKEVLDKGQKFYVPVIAEAGAKGVEIREELIKEDDISLDELSEIIKKEDLECVYSAPVTVWNENGELNKEVIYSTVAKAIKLRAKIVKFSLGNLNFSNPDIKVLKKITQELNLEKHNLKFTVENDQTSYGGNLNNLCEFFNLCDNYEVPISMTFDVGNWNWTKEDPIKAAKKLSKYVVYIHFKHVELRNEQLITLPLPEESDASWRNVMKNLPEDAIKAIEFPIAAENLKKETAKYVELLSKI